MKHSIDPEKYEELVYTLVAAWSSLDELLRDLPRLEGKLCGAYTLGNLRAEIWGALHKQRDESCASEAIDMINKIQAMRDGGES